MSVQIYNRIMERSEASLYEGNFGIFTLFNNKNKVASFILKFTIGFHIDDEYVWNFLKNKLGFGLVYHYKNTVSFTVTKKVDILKLIDIFDKYTLNTSKFLDFIEFKIAFTKYYNREKLTEELIAQILQLKININTNCSNFNIPENHINITKSWLLGFI